MCARTSVLNSSNLTLSQHMHSARGRQRIDVAREIHSLTGEYANVYEKHKWGSGHSVRIHRGCLWATPCLLIRQAPYKSLKYQN